MLEATIDRFGYRKGDAQLVDVEISLGVGRTVLLGPNGAGKSTLLKALAGVVGFEGALRLDGQDVTTRTRRTDAYRASVGWLPQSIVPFPGLSVREHVAYVGWLKGLTSRGSWTEAATALERVGLSAKAKEPAHRLSGGQMRRMGIAGVLVHDARYLLLDEPTAGLDPREQDRLVDVLRTLEASHAVLVSTHDANTLIAADSTVHVLHQGSTTFTGSYDAFVRDVDHVDGTERVRRAYAKFAPGE